MCPSISVKVISEKDDRYDRRLLPPAAVTNKIRQQQMSPQLSVMPRTKRDPLHPHPKRRKAQTKSPLVLYGNQADQLSIT